MISAIFYTLMLNDHEDRELFEAEADFFEHEKSPVSLIVTTAFSF